MLVANSLDRTPGDLEDASAILGGKAWDTARRITIPLALPAMLAGALVAFLQAMTLFGSPAILAMPAGFHTMTTKIWSLFQFPPKPELAAAASLPLLVLTVILLRAEHMVLGRRGYSVVGGKNSEPRIVRLGGWRWVLLAGAMLVLMCPVFLPYFALLNASFSKVASHLVWFNNFTLQNLHFVFYELSATQLALRNTFILGMLAATAGTILAVVISYVTARQAVAGHRTLGFLATAPVAIPGIVLGVGLFFTYTRPPFVLYGTLWILLIAFVTLSLPAAYQQMQSALHAVHPELEDASRILGATRLRVTLADHRAVVAHQRDRDMVLCLRWRDPRIIGGDHAVHLGNQGVIGADLRSQRERRSRRHRGARAADAGHHLRRRSAGQQPARRQCAPQRRGRIIVASSNLPKTSVAEHLAETRGHPARRKATADGAARNARIC